MRFPTPALWRCLVLTVHDGDTVTVMVDRGFDDTTTLRIRLVDVFAPELGQTGGRECRDYVLGWLADCSDRSPWPFLLETFRTPRSDVEVVTLGRYVGRVGVMGSASMRWLNDDVQAFVDRNGYAGGTGS